MANCRALVKMWSTAVSALNDELGELHAANFHLSNDKARLEQEVIKLSHQLQEVLRLKQPAPSPSSGEQETIHYNYNIPYHTFAHLAPDAVTDRLNHAKRQAAADLGRDILRMFPKAVRFDVTPQGVRVVGKLTVEVPR